MKRISSVLCLLLLLLGCKTVEVREDVTDPKCPNSLINPIKTEWIIGAGVVKIGILEVLKRNPDLIDPVVKGINDLAYALESDPVTGYVPTYAGWATAVLAKINMLNESVSAGSIIVAGDIIAQVFVDADVEIDICDKTMLLRDLGQLKMLVLSMKGG